MKDALDRYAEPHDPQRPVVCFPVVCFPVVCFPVVCFPVVCFPVVCFDETSTQLLVETYRPCPPSQGDPAPSGLRVPEGGNPQPVPGL